MGKLLPAMTQQKLDTQRDVVMNERRWTMDNQPYGSWMEKLPALCFPPGHPFHHSLMGSMEDLTAASLHDVEQFFATYYTPDNAVLSITGDFEPADARRLVEKHFGEIPRGAGKPPLPDMSLPPVFGEWRREVVPDDIMLPRLFLAFRSPVFGTNDYYPASTCGAVLGLRNASLLRRRLVRERQVAAEVSAFTYDLSKGTDLLVIDATARPGVTAEQLEQEVANEIDAIVRDGVSDEDVERAVAVIQTMFVSAMQQSAERADRISLFATYLGDPTKVNDEVGRYRDVSAKAVNAFIHERLGESNRASLVYVPREASSEELVGSGAAAAIE
jgi:predicted Zn-dependent peptidase